MQHFILMEEKSISEGGNKLRRDKFLLINTAKTAGNIRETIQNLKQKLLVPFIIYHKNYSNKIIQGIQIKTEKKIKLTN